MSDDARTAIAKALYREAPGNRRHDSLLPADWWEQVPKLLRRTYEAEADAVLAIEGLEDLVRAHCEDEGTPAINAALMADPTAGEYVPPRDGGSRYTIAVDFDGVLHSYVTPWIDATTIPDPPVEGAIEWLNGIARQFDVVILTTRGKTDAARQAVCGWLRKHGYEGTFPEVTDRKVPALVYVDDRGWRFEGSNFPTADEVHQARPWNKGGRRGAAS